MAVFEIYFEAKCRHCKFFEPIWKGKRKFHRCSHPENNEMPLTLKSKKCENFKL